MTIADREVIKESLDFPPGYELIRWEGETNWCVYDISCNRTQMGEFTTKFLACAEAWRLFGEKYPIWAQHLQVWLWRVEGEFGGWWGTIRARSQTEAQELLQNHLCEYLIVDSVKFQLWSTTSTFTVAEGHL